LPSPAYKRAALNVLLLPRAFPHEHEAGLWVSLTEHDLPAASPQAAAAAGTRDAGQFFKGSDRWQRVVYDRRQRERGRRGRRGQRT